MIHITISSLVGHPIRKLTLPGFTNTFVIGKVKPNEFTNSRYVIIDRRSMVILTDADELADIIINLKQLLEGKRQADLNLIIEKIQRNT